MQMLSRHKKQDIERIKRAVKNQHSANARRVEHDYAMIRLESMISTTLDSAKNYYIAGRCSTVQQVKAGNLRDQISSLLIRCWGRLDRNHSVVGVVTPGGRARSGSDPSWLVDAVQGVGEWPGGAIVAENWTRFIRPDGFSPRDSQSHLLTIEDVNRLEDAVGDTPLFTLEPFDDRKIAKAFSDRGQEFKSARGGRGNKRNDATQLKKEARKKFLIPVLILDEFAKSTNAFSLREREQILSIDETTQRRWINNYTLKVDESECVIFAFDRNGNVEAETTYPRETCWF